MRLRHGLLLLALLPLDALAEHTRVSNPNAVSVEILGRSMQWSVAFDRVVSDDLAAGIGYGRAPLNDPAGNDAGLSVTLLPAYVNYYFARAQGSLYLTAGASLVTNSTSVQDYKSQLSLLKFSSSAVQATVGVGYENRSDNGFLLRIAGYALLAANVVPWGGIAFGYSF